MYAVVTPITYTLGLFVPDTKSAQLLLLLIAGAIGTVIYGITILKTHVGEEILGARAVKLAHKLHLKK
jgi:hypothetical protein